MDRVAAIALGSNLGARRDHLAFGIARLGTLLAGLTVSSIHETDPIGVDGTQPRYLNAAAVGSTALSPRELLEALLAIERERGRERPRPNAPRTLDLDLILLGALVAESPDLWLPHPRFRERRFVLEPLREIAPDLVDPVTGETVAALAARVQP